MRDLSDLVGRLQANLSTMPPDLALGEMTGTSAAARSKSAVLHASVGPEVGLFVGGQRLSGGAGQFDVEDPATREVIARVSDGAVLDAVRAVDAASAAFGEWSRTSPRHRSDVLRNAWELMLAESQRIADLICAENGKSIADAHGEVAYAAEFLRWYSEEAVRSDGQFAVAPSGGARSIIGYRPVGVAALVTPWNFPAAMITRKVAPALAAGCTAVLKPAAETPLTALAIADILVRAGVPSGVLNVVPSSDPASIVGTWLRDERVRKLSFTGSTAVGQALLRSAADKVINVSMELGGSAPFIVTAGADVSAAIEGAMLAKFRNGGQACTAANAFFVHSSIAEEFTEGLGARVERLNVGPSISGAEIGPVISAKAQRRIEQLFEDSLRRGASARFMAQIDTTVDGYFVAPCLIEDVQDDDPLLTGEVFGPIAAVSRWTDADDLVVKLNRSALGLAGYIYDQSVSRAVELAERLEIGMVGINRGVVSDASAPFGGFKQSGLGREGARDGLRAFQEPQYLSVAWD